MSIFKNIRKLLLNSIRNVSSHPEDFCVHPGKDFVRHRKIPFEKLLFETIGLQSGSLSNELIRMFDTSADMPSVSAFVQQRDKVKPEAFASIFKSFSSSLLRMSHSNLPLLAVDGSKIQIAANPFDPDTYFPGTNGQKPYGLIHLNALYDLEHRLYVDALIQKARLSNEHRALTDMVDRSNLPVALVIADRGYESYNNMAHIQEKGWYYLIRIKDGKHGIKDGLSLPDTDCFDIPISLKLTRKQTKDVKELLKDRNCYRFIPQNSHFDFLPATSRKKDPVQFYELNFRIVRFPLSDKAYETVITNLNRSEYPPSRLKKLYAMRWGIETSFRDLKYTLGMLNFHSKKVMLIQQEIYAHLIMYNFTEMITSHVAILQKSRKHLYKANFSVAVHMCRLFYAGETSPPVLKTIIAKNLIPIRPDRHRDRFSFGKTYHGFLYRVA